VPIIGTRQLNPAKPINLDGDLNEWRGFRQYRVGNNSWFSAGWNNDGIAVCAFVADTTSSPRDCIEFFINLDSARTAFASSLQGMLSISPTGTGLAWVGTSWDSRSDSLSQKLRESSSWACTIGIKGYMVEAYIPFSAFRRNYEVPSQIGFDVSIVNASEAGNTIDYDIWSKTVPSGRHNPLQWGRMELRRSMLGLKIALMVAVFLLMIVLMMLSIVSILQQRKSTGTNRSARVVAVLRYIEDHVHESTLTCASACADLTFDMQEISALVHTEMGTSFENLLNLARIRRIKNLLRKAECSNDEITKKCGFENVSQGEDAFFLATGTTFKAFRELLKKEPVAESDEE
jgi:AraC-like DNA-binding protein